MNQSTRASRTRSHTHETIGADRRPSATDTGRIRASIPRGSRSIAHVLGGPAARLLSAAERLHAAAWRRVSCSTRRLSAASSGRCRCCCCSCSWLSGTPQHQCRDRQGQGESPHGSEYEAIHVPCRARLRECENARMRQGMCLVPLTLRWHCRQERLLDRLPGASLRSQDRCRRLWRDLEGRVGRHDGRHQEDPQRQHVRQRHSSLEPRDLAHQVHIPPSICHSKRTRERESERRVPLTGWRGCVDSKLRHPNIVPFLGACFEPEFCLVLDFCEHGSLFHVLADKTIPIDWAVRQLPLIRATYFVQRLTHSIIHSFTHSLIHSFTHSLIHSFTHSLIHSFSWL